jgi:hypothetical protein
VGFRVGADRVADDYSGAGADATWAGMTRATLFRDRLDRLFSCGGYALAADGGASVSLHVLHAELTDRDVATMPDLPLFLVERSDLNGSPGRAWEEGSWRLASCASGTIEIERLPWSQKRPTKQQVARKPDADPLEPGLLDGTAAAEAPGPPPSDSLSTRLDRQTLVIAHAQDVDHDEREAVLARPGLNNRGSRAWCWRSDLLPAGASGGDRAPVGAAPPPPLEGVPDAPGRLRRRPGQGTGPQGEARGR